MEGSGHAPPNSNGYVCLCPLPILREVGNFLNRPEPVQAKVGFVVINISKTNLKVGVVAI